MYYIVAIEITVYTKPLQWLAPWAGNPGRTCFEKEAKLFQTTREASKALAKARKYRPFPNAIIYRIY
jgi:hypothetical protein